MRKHDLEIVEDARVSATYDGEGFWVQAYVYVRRADVSEVQP